jgi:hypothetical protein
MKKPFNRRSPSRSTITYDDLYERLSAIDSMLPDSKKVLAEMKTYLNWTRENYRRMDKKAKEAVRSELHLKTELVVTQALNQKQGIQRSKGAV